MMACAVKCHYDHKLKEEEKEGKTKEETEKLLTTELENMYKIFRLNKKEELLPDMNKGKFGELTGCKA